MYSVAMGIQLYSVEAKIEGEINLNGLVGNGGPVAFTKIRGTITVVTDATDDELKKLKSVVDTHCPLLATLTQSVSCDLSLEHKKTDVDNSAKDPVQKDGLLAVIGAGKEDKDALAFTYTSSSHLHSDTLQSVVSLPGSHVMKVDEPSTMPGGNNTGPNPLDVFLASLGTCQEITWKMYGTVMGIPITSVSADVQAPIDLRGLVGLDDDAVAFDKISAKITVESPADTKALEGLKAAVDTHCPVVSTIKEKIDVDLKLVRGEFPELQCGMSDSD